MVRKKLPEPKFERKNGKKSRFLKGFTLAEAAIALALISILSIISMTSIQVAATSRERAENVRFFRAETANLLECYRLDGSAKFAENVEKQLLINLGDWVCEDGEYVLSYSSEYALTDVEEDVRFVLTVTLSESGFYAEAMEGERVIFQMKEPFLSRFDM